MTDVVTNPAPSSGASTSRSLPPPTPTSTHSERSLHSMSTRSSDALQRRQSNPQQQPSQQSSAPSGSTIPAQQPPDPHGLPSVEGRLTRKRARSINVEEANHPRANELSLQSPAFGGATPSSTSTLSHTDLICICPSPPKVPRPRNAFILYRQHHQAGVVLKYPGLANPDISKIIGEHWRAEEEGTKNYWKRLAEEEKARHQRQFPQYKYQPRRGGKGGAAARAASAASAAGEGGDPGRCPKCGGRYISTPRTPSTPFGGIPGPGQGPPREPPSGADMQPFTNNPRVIETVYDHHQSHPHDRHSLESQHGGGGGGGGGDSRRLSYYYPHHPEPPRLIEEDYEDMPPSMSLRRGPQHDEYNMMTSPDAKRRRFGQFDRFPDHQGSPLTAAPPHHQQSQQYHPSMMPTQQPYPPHLVQQPHPGSRRGSGVSAGGPFYGGQTVGGGIYQMSAGLPRPRDAVGGPTGPQSQQKQQSQQSQQSQQQQQQQQRDIGMAPPPRPARLSTAAAGGLGGGVPPPPPGLPAPPRTGPSNFDESLTLAPLQIPQSPTQASDTSGGPRSLSGGGPAGLGMTPATPEPVQGQPQQRGLGAGTGAGAGAGAGDSQTRGIEAMVMSIPYMNKLDVLRKISPPLGPPGPASPVGETRGPVIAIEGANAALLEEVRAVVERALRSSGECEVRVWSESSADRAPTPPLQPLPAEGKKGEDVEMADAAAHQEKTSLAGGSRRGSVSVGSGGRNTPTPRPGSGGGGSGGSSGNNNAPAAAGTFDYLRTILGWHTRSGEMVKHVTSSPGRAGADDDDAAAPTRAATTPVALIAGGFSLTLSDRFASTVAITDPYSPVDHWQWMATLWRGIVGPDLVVYVRELTADEAARDSGGAVEYRAPGVMVVRASGDKVAEKTERRLAFEVMEWVRAGSFRDGYSFGAGPEGA